MPKLRRLSGDEVIAIARIFGFALHTQRGSHVKLRRILPGGIIQSVTVPRHRILDPGTLRAIMRQLGRFILEEELRLHFYTE